MTTVIYNGACSKQVNWGDNDDPRGLLKTGATYEVEYVEMHNWHTKIKLVDVNGLFNDASFSYTQPQQQ